MSVNDKREYISRPLEKYVSVEEHIKAVRKAAKGLHNPTFDAEVEESWGNTSARVFISGYRDLSPDEIREKREKRREQAQAQEAREREQLARLTEKYGAPKTGRILHGDAT